MDGFSTAILIIPCVWLGIAVQNPNTPFGIFIVIALLCGFAGANFASSMGNISFFFPKAKQGSALGINGGLGNLGVSVMQLVAPLVIFVPVFAFLGVNGVPQADGSVMSLANAAWIWVPLLAIATIAAWSGMNDIASSRASIADQLPVLQRLHLWLLSLLYLATFGSFIGFLRVLPCWQNPVPGCEYSAPGVLWPIYRCHRAIGWWCYFR